MARKQFLADYAYVIYLTGRVDEELTMPEGFNTRTSAVNLLSLGQTMGTRV